ncbi:hypothetical protein [Levilactobacillus brevis]|uniref:hypothetical protein n=1 Tax=Levilactobacillus brevis TaxID=1580 RepID=UPI0020733500|nr:hypothetical protein [Levilactobacillus brevis]
MLIMDGLEIKKLALGGQEFIKKPEITDYWDFYVGTITYDIALSSDENYLYIFYSTGIQKVDRKGKLVWTYKYLGSSNINVGTATSDGYVLFADNDKLYSLKDNGQDVSYFNSVGFGNRVTALAADVSTKTYVGLSQSDVILYDMSNKNSQGINTLFTVENSSYQVTSLFLNNDVLIAASNNGKYVRYYLSTKAYKKFYPFSGTIDDSNVFASVSGNQIICSNGTSSELVLLDIDLNVINSSSTSVPSFKSCIFANGYIYTNAKSSSAEYAINKFDLNLKLVMRKMTRTDSNSKLVYSKSDDALYVAHDTYYVGKFSTYFA